MPGFVEQSSKAGVTQLLKAWSEGDDVALERLTPVVENELRRIARRCMAREKPGHILQSAALVNEAYLRLVDIQAVSWQDRTHFFAMCARLMRRILTDYARARNFQKRGGGAVHYSLDSLDQGLLVTSEKQADIMALDEALTQFALLYPRQSQVGVALFWRPRGGRGRGGPEDIRRDRGARLEICEGLATARY
jgi:RNA polymerase sigma factor (TIGR02999 family)